MLKITGRDSISILDTDFQSNQTLYVSASHYLFFFAKVGKEL